MGATLSHGGVSRPPKVSHGNCHVHVTPLRDTLFVRDYTLVCMIQYTLRVRDYPACMCMTRASV